MGSQASLLPYGLSHGPWATSTDGDTLVPGGKCAQSLNSVPVTDRLSKVLTGVQSPREASRSSQRYGKAGQQGPACQEADPSVDAAWTETRGGC